MFLALRLGKAVSAMDGRFAGFRFCRVLLILAGDDFAGCNFAGGGFADCGWAGCNFAGNTFTFVGPDFSGGKYADGSIALVASFFVFIPE